MNKQTNNKKAMDLTQFSKIRSQFLLECICTQRLSFVYIWKTNFKYIAYLIEPFLGVELINSGRNPFEISHKIVSLYLHEFCIPNEMGCQQSEHFSHQRQERNNNANRSWARLFIKNKMKKEIYMRTTWWNFPMIGTQNLRWSSLSKANMHPSCVNNIL